MDPPGGDAEAQALAALERGDYRRAAFIYCRLLSDFRQAAAALARGGGRLTEPNARRWPPTSDSGRGLWKGTSSTRA